MTRQRLVGLASALLLLGYVVALPPHLVHHAFDGDGDYPRCPYLTLGEQAQDLAPGAPAPLGAEGDTAATAVPPARVPPGVDLAAPAGRSPPLSPLLV